MANKRVLSGLPYTLGSYIYIIKCGKYYKIGRTQRIGARMTDYRVHNPYPIKLIYYLDCGYSNTLEKILHDQLSNFNHTGEWFILNKNQIKEIINFIKLYVK